MFGRFFQRSGKRGDKKSVTVLSVKREISIKTEIAQPTRPKTQAESFWEDRGRFYAALFSSMGKRAS